MTAKYRVIKAEDVPWRRNDDPRDWLYFRRLIWEETGSKELTVGIGELAPGKVLGLHHHEGDAEFYYVLAGKAKITLDEEVVDAVPGTAIYIPPSAKHKIVNNGKEKFVMIYGLNAPTRRYEWDEPLKD
jgi:quercetin dioxygenase-like cupin family protein